MSPWLCSSPVELQGERRQDLSFSPFSVWAFHPHPSHKEKAQGLTNISSLPAGDGASSLQSRSRAFKQPKEAGAGEVQGQGLFCEDQGTPWLWGGQAACRAVRDAVGDSTQKAWCYSTPEPAAPDPFVRALVGIS